MSEQYIPDTDYIRNVYVNGTAPTSAEEYRYANDEFNDWLDVELRKARAEAWDEAIALAASTLRCYQDGDQFGGSVTVKDMAQYIPEAINPYDDEKAK